MTWKSHFRFMKALIGLAAALLLAAQCADAQLSISDTSGDSFARIPVGTSRAQTLTVVNSGKAAALLGAVSTEALGLGAPFSLTGGTCASGGSVPADGGSCTLVVTFSPTQRGDFYDAIALKYDWSDSGGSDRVARWSLSGSADDRLLFDPLCGGFLGLPGAYWTRPIGSATSQTFTLTNRHSVDAILNPLSDETLGLSAPFSLSGGTCLGGRIAAYGGACTLDITFSPTSAGTWSLDYYVSYRFADESTLRQIGACRVSGTGIEPIAVSGAPAFDFRELSLGSAAKKRFVVTNWHDEDLVLSAVTSAGIGLEAPFALSGGTCSSGTIRGKGGQCSLDVTFLPNSLGPASDSINLKYRLATQTTEATLSLLALTGSGVTADPVTAIGAGWNHSCALLASGNVRCWGEGSQGQLGYGNTQNIGDDESPSTAGSVSVGGRVIQIVAGRYHSCALLDAGNVRCWGAGGSGALGYGNMNRIGNDELPVSAGDVNIGGRVVQLAAGSDHTCALLDTGNVRCWGAGYKGQLGYGNANKIGDDELPVSAGDVNVGRRVVQLAADYDHTCALLDTGNVRCWGWGQDGQLGYGNTYWIGTERLPVSAGDVNVGGAVVHVSAGSEHTCALLTSGNVRCWGFNRRGQLGYAHTNSIGDDEAPASAGDVNVGGSVRQVAALGGISCALLDTGNVRCWGDGSSGQLGYGNTVTIGDDEPPASAGDIQLGGQALQIDAGLSHVCALLTTGRVRCWGGNYYGELGYPLTGYIGDDEFPSSPGDVTIQ
ncbi:MAG TPA: choice-of-anchor D domain-containing protein [Polyangiaceae bacterium]